MTQSAVPEEFGPLSPAVLHILMALSEGERHGYGIMQSVALQSDGAFRMGPGTLYGSIKRMLASGLISESEERPDPDHANERRRYYRLTGSGEAAFQAEIKRLERILKQPAARNVLAPVVQK